MTPSLALSLTLSLTLSLDPKPNPKPAPDPDPKLAFCVQVYDADGNNSIERDELHKMFTSMLSGGMTDDTADMSDELKELIDDFVNSIYDSIDCDRSGSLEFDEVAEVIEKRKITDVWEIFGRTLVSSVA